MNVLLTLVVAIIAVGLLGTFHHALWRGWGHASKDMPPMERRVVPWGVVALVLLLPFALAVVDASNKTKIIAIAIAVAAWLPVLIVVGMRDHRRREIRIQARRHGTSTRDG